MNRDVDFRAEAGERFVDRVVDDLVNEMMQPGRPRGADVHRRALANRLKAFEDLDAVCAVIAAVARPLPGFCSVSVTFVVLSVFQTLIGMIT